MDEGLAREPKNENSEMEKDLDLMTQINSTLQGAK
jgi:hypothetical protein